MTLSKETLEEIAELARKATYKPCAMHITNLVARCDSEVVEELIRELLERRERDKQEPVGYTYNRGINCEIVAADLNADCPCGIDLYAAPPAPVVPEECPAAIRDLIASTCDELFDDDDAQQIWGACRAAMLKENKK